MLDEPIQGSGSHVCSGEPGARLGHCCLLAESENVYRVEVTFVRLLAEWVAGNVK